MSTLSDFRPTPGTICRGIYIIYVNLELREYDKTINKNVNVVLGSNDPTCRIVAYTWLVLSCRVAYNAAQHTSNHVGPTFQTRSGLRCLGDL